MATFGIFLGLNDSTASGRSLTFRSPRPDFPNVAVDDDWSIVVEGVVEESVFDDVVVDGGGTPADPDKTLNESNSSTKELEY